MECSTGIALGAYAPFYHRGGELTRLQAIDESTKDTERGRTILGLCLSHLYMSGKMLIVQRKPYMASVSPLFFTHYGKTGDWAFNKYVTPVSSIALR
jgi:hypothetical protein